MSWIIDAAKAIIEAVFIQSDLYDIPDETPLERATRGDYDSQAARAAENNNQNNEKPTGKQVL